MMEYLRSFHELNKKYLIILLGITILNIVYGLDVRFTIINILWILINLSFKNNDKHISTLHRQ